MLRSFASRFAPLFAVTIIACGGKSEPTPGAAPSEKAPSTATTTSPPVEAAVEAPAPESFGGVAFEVTIEGKTESLALSEELLARRGEGPLAVFDCAPGVGSVGVTDFGVGDDRDRRGELFVARVDLATMANVRQEREYEARIQLRRSGEPTPTSYRGSMIWDAGFASGSARGATQDGAEVSLKWRCEPKGTRGP